MKQVKQILIIHQGALGDFIVSLPAIGAFRFHYPHATITIWGHPEILRLAHNRFYADTIASLEQPGLALFYNEQGFAPSPLAERFNSFDLIGVFGGKQQSIFVDNLNKTGAGEVYHIFTFPPHDSKTPVVDFQATQLSSLGLTVQETVPKLFVSEAAARNAAHFLGQRGRTKNSLTVALHPGSGSRKKAWTVNAFVALAEKLYRDDQAQILVPIGPADTKVAEDYFNGISSPGSIPLHNLPLDELAAILKQCDLYVGNDSGITHLAAAVGTPALALFGPTDHHVWAPRRKSVSILHGKTDCAPCSREKMQVCLHKRCLETITVEEVYGKAAKMLQEIDDA
jgi:ADP-heptose:LPS heptosyltransferase